MRAVAIIWDWHSPRSRSSTGTIRQARCDFVSRLRGSSALVHVSMASAAAAAPPSCASAFGCTRGLVRLALLPEWAPEHPAELARGCRPKVPRCP